MAHRYLGEAELARQGGHAPLVLGIAIGLHEDDRDRLDAGGQRRRQLGPQRNDIRLLLHRAVGAHALVGLDDTLVEHFRLDDVAGKNLRARLVADLERIAETPGGDEERTLALALEQGVGRDRGAHLHAADDARGNRRAWRDPDEIADALHGGVAIGLRILGQKLVSGERAVGAAPDHVGKGAPAIDPEIPTPVVPLAVRPHHCPDRIFLWLIELLISLI